MSTKQSDRIIDEGNRVTIRPGTWHNRARRVPRRDGLILPEPKVGIVRKIYPGERYAMVDVTAGSEVYFIHVEIADLDLAE